jgi:hypothetical protein
VTFLQDQEAFEAFEVERTELPAEPVDPGDTRDDNRRGWASFGLFLADLFQVDPCSKCNGRGCGHCIPF